MYRLTKTLIVVSFLGVFLFGLNAYALTQFNLPNKADKTAKLAVIEGHIKSIDLEETKIVLKECDLLGHKPLMLTGETECYIGNEKTDIVSIRGGSEFKKSDKLHFNQLRVGDYIKCNYSRRNGNFFVVRIIRITPETTQSLLE